MKIRRTGAKQVNLPQSPRTLIVKARRRRRFTIAKQLVRQLYHPRGHLSSGILLLTGIVLISSVAIAGAYFSDTLFRNGAAQAGQLCAKATLKIDGNTGSSTSTTPCPPTGTASANCDNLPCNSIQQGNTGVSIAPNTIHQFSYTLTNAGTVNYQNYTGDSVGGWLSANYTPVDYVTFDGNSYVNTGTAYSTTDSSMRWDIDMKYNNSSAADEQINGQVNNGGTQWRFFISNYSSASTASSKGVWAAADGLTTSNGVHISTATSLTRHVYSIEYNRSTTTVTGYLDGASAGTKTTAAAPTANQGTLFLGAARNSAAGTADYWVQETVYGSKITKNGTVVQNLVPAINNISKACGFYDTVSSSFFVSAAGTLTCATPTASANTPRLVIYPASTADATITSAIAAAKTAAAAGTVPTFTGATCAVVYGATTNMNFATDASDTGCQLAATNSNDPYNVNQSKTYAAVKFVLFVPGTLAALANNQIGYVQNGLVVQLDGINNTGGGDVAHSTGATTWKDLSGHGYDFTVMGGTWNSNSISLNGASSQGLRGPNAMPSALKLSNLTMETVFKSTQTTQPTDSQVLFNSFQNGGAGQELTRNSGSMAANNTFYVWNSSANNYTSFDPAGNDITFGDNVVHTWASSYNGSQMGFRLDGGNYYTQAVGNTLAYNATTPWAIGANPGTDGTLVEQFFTGQIYAARLYNRALTADEICQNQWADYYRFATPQPTCTLPSNSTNLLSNMTVNFGVASGARNVITGGGAMLGNWKMQLHPWVSAGVNTTYVPTMVSNFTYTGAVQTFTAPVTGNYKLEVWGAQGGDSNNNRSGKGGYSVGQIYLTAGTTLNVYVGGQSVYTGSTGLQAGGWNGGGSGYADGTGRGGGGGTDIRINSTSLYARVIVAGGGGGDQNAGTIGPGGGTSGLGMSPGTQTTAGSGGAFGQGGNITTSYGGGGGGGWYGGGVLQNNAGSGGSGYIYTAATAGNCPSGCLLNSAYYLTSAQTAAGNTSFAAPGGGTETGHTGNGYARITLLQPVWAN